MAREVELKIYNINRKDLVKKLKILGARSNVKKVLKRVTFELKSKGKINDKSSLDGNDKYFSAWVRVRTDGTKTTLTMKEQYGTGISKRFEYEVEVSDFVKTVKIIRALIPNSKYNYIETSRESYFLDDTEITIDKWPCIPFQLEIEASSEKKVYKMYKKLNIKNKPSPNLALTDDEFYKLNEIDYNKIQVRYRKKLEKLFN